MTEFAANSRCEIQMVLDCWFGPEGRQDSLNAKTEPRVQLLAVAKLNFAPVAQSGLSGAAVYRVWTETGQTFALKRYPQGTTTARVSEIHRVMRTARSQGCHFVPEVFSFGQANQTIAVHNQCCWELVRWVPGAPFESGDESRRGLSTIASSDENKIQIQSESAAVDDVLLQAVATGAKAIARFHQSVRCMGQSLQIAPGVIARQNRLQQLSELIQPIATAKLEEIENDWLRNRLREAVQQVLTCWAAQSHRMMQLLSLYCHHPIETQYVLRDVHRGHVLFATSSATDSRTLATGLPINSGTPRVTSPRVTGLIDYDAVRVDAPAFDLARWASGFLATCTREDIIWDACLAGYRLESAFDEQQESLARQLAWVSAWISTANWVAWVLLDRLDVSTSSLAVANRIDQNLKILGSHRNGSPQRA